MDKKFLSSLNHDLSFRPGIILEALEKGVKFGTKEFFLYSQLRWYETDGRFGYCVAGNERLAEDVGMTVREVENALYRLKEAGLVEHVWCDKKIYRNKTKIWVSVVRLSGVCTNFEAIKVLKKGGKNIRLLGEEKEKIGLSSIGLMIQEESKTTCAEVETTCAEVETTCAEVETTCAEVVAPPVITEVGNTNRNTNRNNAVTITTIEDSNKISESCSHNASRCSNSKNRSESENESEKVLDPTQERNSSLKENRSEGAELISTAPHSSNVNSNPFGTVQEKRSKGIEGYLAGLGKRMGLYASRNLRNTAKAYRLTKTEMTDKGIDFESFMKVVEENITLQEASPKENKVAITRLDDVFNKWDKVADQLKASGVWSDIKLPEGWFMKENPGYRPNEYDRYCLYKDGLWERTRYRDGVVAFSDNDGNNFVYAKIILDIKKDGSAKFKGIKLSDNPEEF